MSLNIMIYSKSIDDSIKKRWLEELVKRGIECEIHPEFTFENQTGFLPFKCEILRKDIPLNNRILLSGFELDVIEYIQKEEIKKQSIFKRIFSKNKEYREEKNNNLMNSMKKELLFSISSQDSLEFILGMYSAAILTYLTGGILYDPQEDKYFDKENALDMADNAVNEYICSLKEIEWITHNFSEWQ